MKKERQSRREARAAEGPPPIELTGGVGERPQTRQALLAAAQTSLCEQGYAGLSTRRVAELAGVPLSQIHYHFGSKQGLVLALLADQNARLLARQAATFAEPLPLSLRWERACDYLDEDLSSGYVRALQEMVAAGWSDPRIADAVRENLQGWYDLLTGLAEEASRTFSGLGPFTPAEVACLVGNAFLGSEALILLGLESPRVPTRTALRRVASFIRGIEDEQQADRPVGGSRSRSSDRKRKA